MSATTEKPVVTASQVTAAFGSVWAAVLIVCQAFDLWDPTQEQTAAITGLWTALTVVFGLVAGKVAASRVTPLANVDRVVAEVRNEAQAKQAAIVAEMDKRVAEAESFGRPHQDQSPHPRWGLVGGHAPSACVCGNPGAPGVVHRTDGPCYMDDQPNRIADPSADSPTGRRSSSPWQ